MAWRGNINTADRLYGCLPYLLPMSSAVFYGVFLFIQAPVLAQIFTPILELRRILSYPVIPQVLSLEFIVFILLYIFVVRNDKVCHFIRFNTMQALLLGIALILIELAVELISPVFSATTVESILFLIQVFASTIFVGMNSICVFAIAQCLRGVYAEMPIISEAAYYQVRY
jgi:hypothetical protein